MTAQTFKTPEKRRMAVRASLAKKRKRNSESGLCVDCSMAPACGLVRKSGKRSLLCLYCLEDRRAREVKRQARLKAAQHDA